MGGGPSATMAMATELDTLRWQYALTWRLAGHHLPRLTDAGCLWEPAPHGWTVHQDADGQWRPDWSDAEPDPAPTTSIGWLTWHLTWWWSSATAAFDGVAPPAREAVFWPGSADAVRRTLNEIADGWKTRLTALPAPALERPVSYPWREPQPLTRMLAWANCELMKNIAEIGTIQRLYEATHRRKG